MTSTKRRIASTLALILAVLGGGSIAIARPVDTQGLAGATLRGGFVASGGRITVHVSQRKRNPLTIRVLDAPISCPGPDTQRIGAIAKGRLESDGRFHIFKSFGGGEAIQYAFDVAGRIVNRHLAKGTFYWISRSEYPSIAPSCVTPNPLPWRAGRDR